MQITEGPGPDSFSSGIYVLDDFGVSFYLYASLVFALTLSTFTPGSSSISSYWVKLISFEKLRYPFLCHPLQCDHLVLIQVVSIFQIYPQVTPMRKHDELIWNPQLGAKEGTFSLLF